jgi:flagellin
MSKISSAADKIGGEAFAITSGAVPDTKTNGTTYAGYQPQTTYTGNQLVVMTNQYGSNQQLQITCNNSTLANMLGIPAAATTAGMSAEGSDVKADFTTQMVAGKSTRIGFVDSAIISTSGTRIMVKDVNNKTFEMDVPGNTAGTVFSDTTKVGGKSSVTGAASKNVVQEVTDVGTMSVHVGTEKNQVIKLDIPKVTTYTLGTDKINVMTGKTASQAISTVDNAIAKANEVRSEIGAYQNRFDQTTDNLSVSTENMTSSLSNMIDTDMAEEMTQYTSMTVLTQAATSILSQANQRPSTVLQLLQK